MTNGAAKRKHNQWLRLLKLDAVDARQFVDDIISEVMDGVQVRRRNKRHNEDVFLFTMRYMPDLTCKVPEAERRAAAFRMALRQAWQQHPVEYFDLELLQQMRDAMTSYQLDGLYVVEKGVTAKTKGVAARERAFA